MAFLSTNIGKKGGFLTTITFYNDKERLLITPTFDDDKEPLLPTRTLYPDKGEAF